VSGEAVAGLAERVRQLEHQVAQLTDRIRAEEIIQQAVPDYVADRPQSKPRRPRHLRSIEGGK
jgi:hypothetical protein